MEFAPQTPRHLIRMDSPMSDYFTDPSNSPDLFTVSPSSAQQEILRRLRALSDWVLRQDLPSNAAIKAHHAIDKLEGILVAPETQSRQPADIDESDLFSPEEELEAHDFGTAVERDGEKPDNLICKECRQAGVAGGLESINAYDKKLLDESREVLSRVSAATQKLQLRYQEVKEANTLAQEAIEQSSVKIMRLRSDNESLRSDISYNYTDLLHLKLRLGTLEAHVISRDVNDSGCGDSRELTDEIDKLKSDWNGVDARLRCRDLQRLGKLQNQNMSDITLGGGTCISDIKPTLNIEHKHDTLNHSHFPFRQASKDQTGEGTSKQYKSVDVICSSARGSNSLPIRAIQHDYPQAENVTEDERSRKADAAKSVNSPPTNSQSRNSSRLAKPIGWAKLWDELAELAGIYDY